jgi:hypothetical protein
MTLRRIIVSSLTLRGRELAAMAQHSQVGLLRIAGI